MSLSVEKNIEIRNFQATDLQRVVRIERESFRSPWPEILFRRRSEMDPDGFSVASCESKVVGYVIGRIEIKKGLELGHLMNLAVDEKYRRQGIGSLLLKEIEDYFKREGARGIWLETREGNRAAEDFYSKHGYEQIDIQEGYYSDGTDALIMCKGL